jgi:hypothetical protein
MPDVAEIVGYVATFGKVIHFFYFATSWLANLISLSLEI